VDHLVAEQRAPPALEHEAVLVDAVVVVQGRAGERGGIDLSGLVLTADFIGTALGARPSSAST
jgi:hypothetical protein